MRERVKPDLVRPLDFDEFWAETLRELGQSRPNLLRTQATAVGEVPQSRIGLDFHDLAFDSLDGARIHGYYVCGPGDRNTIVHSHGYGSEYKVRWDWAQAGLNVLGVDIRGHGRSTSALANRSRHGYVLTGVQSPETSVLRGAVCDYIRAVEVAQYLQALDQPDNIGAQLTLHGVSFAGGLALMAEALTQTANVLAIGVPTFGWVTGRHFYASAGSGGEVRNYLAAHPEFTHDASLVLSYFDAMNFAGQVRCPTLVGLGLIDDVVPAKTVFAIANHLGGPHKVMQFPISHSEHPDEALWQKFDQRCVELALDGVGAGFGTSHQP
jgi:cephalosporin-C deacetylase